MDRLLETTQHIADLLWGWPFMILLAGTGLFLTVLIGQLKPRHSSAPRDRNPVR